ncbi:FAD-dependent oxidoreductase, partial [Deltaproteobacteria bacterium]|nr:FAD-dependent oxidoreductase [Deltaproteobacteria bacterium]
VQKLEIKIELGKEVTPEVIDKIKPDVLVLASGSASYRPDIPGIDKPNVISAIDIFLGKAKAGSKNVIAGGGMIGCEVALFLAQQKKNAILVEMLSDVSMDAFPISGILKAKLIDNGVEILTDTKIIGITDNGVTAIDRNQNNINVEGDRVILAMGLAPNTELYEAVKNKVREVYLIGDCAEPRRVGDATREGYLIGSTI